MVEIKFANYEHFEQSLKAIRKKQCKKCNRRTWHWKIFEDNFKCMCCRSYA